MKNDENNKKETKKKVGGLKKIDYLRNYNSSVLCYG